MGIFSSSYSLIKEQIYDKIPQIHCRACGECCVSPHMTLIEFCYLITSLLNEPQQLASIIGQTVTEHPAFPGQLKCRFQLPDNLCAVHPHRPLACRLHGHAVLKETGPEYHVHCHKAGPAESNLAKNDVYGFLDQLADLNRGYYSYYSPPYWIASLHTEMWLTILTTELPRHVFRLLRKLMLREFATVEMQADFAQAVPLDRKLGLIDRFQATLPHGNRQELSALLDRIQHEFPETGAYYYFEAEMYRDALDGQKEQAVTGR